MTKFNLKEHIAKNQATFLSSLNEGYMGQFYAPEYLEQKYGKEMAKKIEAEIDEMDENSWDRFTGMESAEEVDEYISDIVDMLKEGYDEFERADKGSKDVTAKDKGEEEVYGAGVKKGEEIEKKKMKVSEFKAKIKEMIVAEMNLDVTDETSGYDFLAELEEMMDEEEFSVKLLVPTVYYNPETGELAETSASFGADSELEDMGITNYSDGDELSEWVFDNDIEKAKYFEKEYPGLFKVEGMMSEAKDEEIEDVDIDVEEPETIDEPSSGISVTQNANADLTGTEKELQDNLEAALEAAKKIGDDKLQQQIGNSLTFFTRQHVVKENLNEANSLEKNLIKNITKYLKKRNPTFPEDIIIKKVSSWLNQGKNLMTATNAMGDDFKKDVLNPIESSLTESKSEDKVINESMFPMLKKILK